MESDIPTIWEKNGHIIIHSPQQDGICRQGVALILKKHLGEKIENYKAISSRLLKVTMEWESERVTYFIVYAPDSSYDDLIVEEFFGTLQEEMNLLPPTDKIVLLGDFNASVGNNMQDDWPGVVGNYAVGTNNTRGLKFLQFCAINELFIANSIFKHKEKRRYTWISPDRTEKQIDYIIMSKKLKPTLKNCRSYHSAEIGSDHSIVIANIDVKKSKKYNYTKKRPPRRYDNDKIQNGETSKKFAAELKERLATLLDDDNATTMPNDFYNKFKNIVHTTSELEIGYKQFNEVPGLSNEAKDLCARRRKAKLLVLNNPNYVENINKYRTLNKRVKIAKNE